MRLALTINSNQLASIGNRALTQSQAAMERSLAKLASGQRVASARDDAAAMAIGGRLRAEIAGIQSYRQNATQGVSMLQVVEGVYQRTEDMLIRMRSLATQAQGRNLSSTERAMLNTEYQQIKSEINRLGGSSKFNGTDLFATGPASFGPQVSTGTGGSVGGALIADFDNDGYVDQMTNFNQGAVWSIFSGNPDGTFGSFKLINNLSPGKEYSQIGDFNGDGNMDVLSYGGISSINEFHIAYGNGKMGFNNVIYSAAYDVASIEVGDFNGDGADDVVIGGNDGAAQIWSGVKGTGAPTMTSQILNVGFGANEILSIATGDIDGDGLGDFVVGGNNGRYVAVYGRESGFLIGSATSNTGNPASQTKLGDFNGDGRLDILTYDNTSGSYDILTNNGSGGFTYNGAPFGSGSFLASVGDLNGDGLADIVSVDNVTNNLVLYQNNGGGNFTQTQLTSGVVTTSVALVDGDKDGRLDIYLADVVVQEGLFFRNTSTVGLDGNVRVSSGNGSTDNVQFRAGSIATTALDRELYRSDITTANRARVAEESALRALDQLRKYRTGIGAAVNRLEKVIDNVTSIVDNLENARSAYLDLDIAQEMATFVSKQIVQQAGISMLTQANRSRDILLRLLQG
jgi:flagellin